MSKPISNWRNKEINWKLNFLTAPTKNLPDRPLNSFAHIFKREFSRRNVSQCVRWGEGDCTSGMLNRRLTLWSCHQVRRGLHRLQDALALVEKNTLGLQTNCASVAEEVDEIYRRLSKALKDRTEHLRNEVDRYLGAELRGLIQLKENLELEIANIQSNCDLAEAHINENVPWDDAELLDTKELFLRTVEFIRFVACAQIPQLISPLTISFFSFSPRSRSLNPRSSPGAIYYRLSVRPPTTPFYGRVRKKIVKPNVRSPALSYHRELFYYNFGVRPFVTLSFLIIRALRQSRLLLFASCQADHRESIAGLGAELFIEVAYVNM